MTAAVLDTNVLASGEEPYFSRRLSASEQAEDVALVRHEATLTPITITVQGVATHPQDDIVLTTAASGNADVLVTGDLPFRRRVPHYREIPLLSPREFLDILRSEPEGHRL